MSVIAVDPILDTLRRARELLTPEGAWCRGAAARGKSGRDVAWNSEYAVAFCLVGALWRAGDRNGGAGGVVGRTLLSRGVRHGAAVSDWNDAPSRTQADVLDLLDASIAAVLGGGS